MADYPRMEKNMSENAEVTNNNDASVEETVAEETVNNDAAEQTDIDWKKEARKWEQYAKANKADKELADKWREYESSQKTEHEKLAEELAKEKAEAAQARATLLKYELATEKNLPADALKLLKGSTREELEEEADILLSLLSESVKPKQPQPNPEQGKPAGTSGQISKDELKNMSAQEIMAAKKEGRLDDVLGKN
jgi:hypothetical protein